MAELVPVKYKNLDPQQKFDLVLRGFERGELKDPDGKVVTSRKQAEAIAFSESGLK